ncbi:hypothetical protein DA469_21690 [Bacillus subtilis]|nr:hypothetical protein DA469_21690 [Bacillus subtilis]
MSIKLKIIKDQPKKLKFKDISDGYFLVGDDDMAWMVNYDSCTSRIFLVNLKDLNVKVFSNKEEFKFGLNWDSITILSPKQVNLNIGFQWKDK